MQSGRRVRYFKFAIAVLILCTFGTLGFLLGRVPSVIASTGVASLETIENPLLRDGVLPYPIATSLVLTLYVVLSLARRVGPHTKEEIGSLVLIMPRLSRVVAFLFKRILVQGILLLTGFWIACFFWLVLSLVELVDSWIASKKPGFDFEVVLKEGEPSASLDSFKGILREGVRMGFVAAALPAVAVSFGALLSGGQYWLCLSASATALMVLFVAAGFLQMSRSGNKRVELILDLVVPRFGIAAAMLAVGLWRQEWAWANAALLVVAILFVWSLHLSLLAPPDQLVLERVEFVIPATWLKVLVPRKDASLEAKAFLPFLTIREQLLRFHMGSLAVLLPAFWCYAAAVRLDFSSEALAQFFQNFLVFHGGLIALYLGILFLVHGGEPRGEEPQHSGIRQAALGLLGLSVAGGVIALFGYLGNLGSTQGGIHMASVSFVATWGAGFFNRLAFLVSASILVELLMSTLQLGVAARPAGRSADAETPR